MLTQCPHCTATFRVTESQINTRKGLVRCGNCLQVFNASLNYRAEKSAQQANSPIPVFGQPSKVESQPAEIDNVFTDEDEDEGSVLLTAHKDMPLDELGKAIRATVESDVDSDVDSFLKSATLEPDNQKEENLFLDQISMVFNEDREKDIDNSGLMDSETEANTANADSTQTSSVQLNESDPEEYEDWYEEIDFEVPPIPPRQPSSRDEDEPTQSDSNEPDSVFENTLKRYPNENLTESDDDTDEEHGVDQVSFELDDDVSESREGTNDLQIGSIKDIEFSSNCTEEVTADDHENVPVEDERLDSQHADNTPGDKQYFDGSDEESFASSRKEPLLKPSNRPPLDIYHEDFQETRTRDLLSPRIDQLDDIANDSIEGQQDIGLDAPIFSDGRSNDLDSGEDATDDMFKSERVSWADIRSQNRMASRLVIGCILLLGLLLFQIRFLFLNDLSHIDTLRPALGYFCMLTRCEFPAKTDITKISVAGTEISDHPDLPGALQIKTKLENRADFAQPYPALQLTLTDHVGRIVGRRAFSADTYLDETNPSTRLEPKTPEIVTFNLAQTTESAVGFEVTLVKHP